MMLWGSCVLLVVAQGSATATLRVGDKRQEELRRADAGISGAAESWKDLSQAMHAVAKKDSSWVATDDTRKLLSGREAKTVYLVDEKEGFKPFSFIQIKSHTKDTDSMAPVVLEREIDTMRNQMEGWISAKPDWENTASWYQTKMANDALELGGKMVLSQSTEMGHQEREVDEHVQDEVAATNPSIDHAKQVVSTFSSDLAANEQRQAFEKSEYKKAVTKFDGTVDAAMTDADGITKDAASYAKSKGKSVAKELTDMLKSVESANKKVVPDVEKDGAKHLEQIEGTSETEKELDDANMDLSKLEGEHEVEINKANQDMDTLDSEDELAADTLKEGVRMTDSMEEEVGKDAGTLENDVEGQNSAEEGKADRHTTNMEEFMEDNLATETGKIEDHIDKQAGAYDTEEEKLSEQVRDMRDKSNAYVTSATAEAKNIIGSLKNSIGQRADVADGLASEGERLEGVVDDLSPEVAAGGKLIRESGEKAAKAVSDVGKEFAFRMGGNSKDALQEAEVNQNSVVDATAENTESDLDNAIAESEEAVAENEGRITEKAAELEETNKDAIADVKKQVRGTQSDFRKVEALHRFLEEKWNDAEEAEGPKERGFTTTVNSDASSVDQDMQNTESAMKSNNKEVLADLQKTAKKTTKRTDKAASAAVRAIKKRYSEAEQDVLKTQLVSDTTVKNAEQATINAVERLTSKVLPDAEKDSEDIWDAAMGEVKKVRTRATMTQSKLTEDINGEIGKLKRETSETMKRASQVPAPFVEKNVGQIREGEEGLGHVMDSIHELMEDGGGDAMTDLDDFEGKIKESNEQVKEEKAALLEEAAIAKNAVIGKKNSIRGQQGQENNDFTKVQGGVDAQIAAGEANIQDAGKQTLDEMEQKGMSIVNGIVHSANQFVAGVQKEADGVNRETFHKLGAIDYGGLKKATAAAGANAAHNEAQLQAQLHQTEQSIEKFSAGHAEAANRVNGALTSYSAKVSSDAQNDLQRVGEDQGRAIGQTAAEIAKNAKRAHAEILGYSNDLNDDLNSFVKTSDTALEGEKAKVDGLSKEMREDAGKNAALDSSISSAVNAVKVAAAQKDAQFSSAMSTAGNLLAMGFHKGKQAVDAVVQAMNGELGDMKGAIKDSAQEATETHRSAESDIKNMQESIMDKLNPALNDLNDFKTKISTFEEWQDHVSTESGELDNKATMDLAKDDKTFQFKLKNKQDEYMTRTKDMFIEGDKVFGGLEQASQLLTSMKNKISTQINYTAQAVNAHGRAMDYKMKDMLELEDYQEGEALDRVKKDMADVDDKIDHLRTWRSKADTSANKWRDAVQRTFTAMGEELDVSHLAQQMEAGEQKWAVNQVMQHLSGHLGDDIAGMSTMAKQRLAAMSQAAGAEIARLMADTSLTEEERAQAIAKIKEALAKRAREMLHEDNAVAFAQHSMSRNIGVATKEIENTMMRLASIEGTHGGVKRSFTAKDLHDDLARLSQQVDQAKQNILKKKVEAQVAAPESPPESPPPGEQFSPAEESSAGAAPADESSAEESPVAPVAGSFIEEPELPVEKLYESASKKQRSNAASEAAAFIEQFKSGKEVKKDDDWANWLTTHQ